MTVPEMIFGGIVLTGFAAFIIALASTQFYTRPRPDPVRQARPAPVKRVVGVQQPAALNS